MLPSGLKFTDSSGSDPACGRSSDFPDILRKFDGFWKKSFITFSDLPDSPVHGFFDKISFVGRVFFQHREKFFKR